MGNCSSFRRGEDDSCQSSSEAASFQSTYDIQEKIGSGGFGTIYTVKNLYTNSTLVAKRIKSQNSLRVPAEVDILLKIRHPLIISLLEYYLTPNYTIMIMEYLPNAIDLFDYIAYLGQVSERRSKHVARQLTTALTFLHEEEKVAHLDVKPENILITPKSGYIKLIDFGASVRLEKVPEMFSFSGTKEYASPEVLFYKSFYPIDVDIWSVGVTLYKMIEGKLPFKRSRDYKKPISFTRNDLSPTCTITLTRILYPSLSIRPRSISEVARSPWLV